MHADQPNQPIAFIHGNDVVLVRGAHAVDQKSLNVCFHGLQSRMFRGYLGPRFKAEQRFDGPCRAGDIALTLSAALSR